MVLGLAFCGGSYWFSDKLAIKAARAQPVTREEAPELYAMVEDLAQRADMPMPRVYISPEAAAERVRDRSQPEARGGLLHRGHPQVLDQDELRGVLAHEMAHVKHRDILIGSVAAAVAMAITFVARMAMWGAMFGGGDDDDGGGFIGALALADPRPDRRDADPDGDVPLARVRGRRQRRASPRRRRALARALEKIEVYAKQVPMNVNPAEASAYIINPLTGRKVSFANLFRTHPADGRARSSALRSPERGAPVATAVSRGSW